MSKIVCSILILLICKTCVAEQLCSSKKVDNKCVCKLSISDQKTVGVVTANCAGINLQNFPEKSRLRNDLNVLDLSHNRIRRLDQNRFTSNGLITLKLSYNYIEFVDNDFFKDIPNLERLDLSHNNISTFQEANIFQSLKDLLYLDLSFNSLKVLPDQIFLPLQQINYLDLSYNALGKWLVQSPKALSLNLALNESVTNLLLNNVGLKELHSSYFDNYDNLKHLSLADNQFEDIPNIPYSVEFFDISGSDITMLQAKHLNYHSLKILKLERLKKLKAIHKYAFYNLQALEEVSIRYCHNLNEFNDEIFGVLSKETILPLRKLALADNNLKTLNYTYKYLFDHMDFVDLKNNPWNCDCDLLWIQEYENFLLDKDYIRCSTPNILRTKLVTEITEEEVPNCYPGKYGKRIHRILLPILIILIIVLSALIGYLILYAPSWNRGRPRGIGPHSPYSPSRLEED